MRRVVGYWSYEGLSFSADYEKAGDLRSEAYSVISEGDGVCGGLFGIGETLMNGKLLRSWQPCRWDSASASSSQFEGCLDCILFIHVQRIKEGPK